MWTRCVCRQLKGVGEGAQEYEGRNPGLVGGLGLRCAVTPCYTPPALEEPIRQIVENAGLEAG